MPSKTNKVFSRVQVVKHIPQGLSVQLPDGQSGIVRIRNVSWDKTEIMNWTENFPVGWSGDALLLPSQKDGCIELSIRLVDKDPWDDFSYGFREEQVYEGVVTSVVHYGAFVEITPGLTGLLHKSRLQRPPMELFWPGDKILVTVSKVNQTKRKISLKIAQIPSLSDKKTERALIPIHLRTTGSDIEKILSSEYQRKHILVVENEPSQANALSGWLHRLNQRVDVVESAELAIDFLEKVQPEIALVDIGLPKMSGTDLTEHLLKNYPNVQVINVTDWAHASSIMETLENLQMRGASLLLKPLLPEDLVPFLLHNQEKRKNIPEQSESVFLRETTLPNMLNLDVNKKIQLLLEKCKTHLGFEQATLFSFEEKNRQITVIESFGDALTSRKAIPYLIYSPVRDVVEGKKLIVVGQIDQMEASRFRYLIEFYPSVMSCIGIPVPSETSSKYALFVLDKKRQEITYEQQLYAEGISLAIGTVLDQQKIKEKFVLMQRTALIGHLTRTMMHEINNLIGPLLYSADTLKQSLSKCDMPPNELDCKAIQEDVAEIQQDIRKVINTTKIFGRIVSKGKREILRVDEILEECISLLYDISDRSNVDFRFSPPDGLIIVRSQAVVLEQIFLNVLLNAAQQISDLRPETGGWVKIDMELVSKKKLGHTCRITIQDNGPGIHVSLWEKVFEVGFTTRADGSGIGLYISRNLMTDIGGKILVSSSYILGGTSFVLEFPVIL